MNNQTVVLIAIEKNYKQEKKKINSGGFKKYNCCNLEKEE